MTFKLQLYKNRNIYTLQYSF